MKLYISENNVVLTEGMDGVILPKYFKEVCQADGKKLELKLPHDESVANIAAEPKVILLSNILINSDMQNMQKYHSIGRNMQ